MRGEVDFVVCMKATTLSWLLDSARVADEPAIRALLRQAGLPDEDFAPHLANFIVARRGESVVGAVGYELHGADALLRSLVVEPAERSAGLGRALVATLTRAARTAGVKRFYLLTTTAEPFFVRLDYTKIERAAVPAAVAAAPEFRSLCPASAVCLTRPI